MNYQQVVESLKRREGFKHSTMSAHWEGRYVGKGPTYVVMSYSTVVATWTPQTRELWTTTQHYSVTTSKHMGKIAQGFADLIEDPTVHHYGRYGQIEGF